MEAELSFAIKGSSPTDYTTRFLDRKRVFDEALIKSYSKKRGNGNRLIISLVI